MMHVETAELSGCMDADSLDAFIAGPSTAHGASPSQHLSYPAFDTDPQPDKAESSQSQHPQLCKDRIYIGNLHPSVDEYTLVQVFSKFGKITNVDFLFHKSGPQKGKPRGYAFIKYADENDAERAMSTAHDKPLRGRKLVVTYAHHAPLDYASGSGGKNRRTMMDIGRPTTLSLLKSGSSSRPAGTAAKIARMEAKLRQLERTPESTPVPAPLHPSLPPRPQSTPTDSQANANNSRQSAPKTTLPDNPPPSLLRLASSHPLPSSSSSKTSKPKSKLLGVKIKPKEKLPSPVPPKHE
ncbi:hypothetical protein Agabi119p4_10900 [Agaricus bisporus var. burnettii]|uniref:Probable RNA-binding protein 18 n=1 Tax=Agaricus bisporus var. burnettii TaxID=192524 RepID=A0A8H7EVL8_AGABI|nr:hypothetical protein Agabi119p4_10900 [Agaricus bisporus var. burnettii]